MLNGGNADGDPTQSCDGFQEYVDTDCNNSGGESDFAEKRTHTLSNGNVIWDLAANVSEWVKDNNSTSIGTGYTQWTSLTDTDADGVSDAFGSGQDAFGPLDLTPGFCTNPHLNNYCGFGYIYDGSGGAVIRGGTFSLGAYSGVFHVNLLNGPSNSGQSIGFRCVFRP